MSVWPFATLFVLSGAVAGLLGHLARPALSRALDRALEERREDDAQPPEGD